MNSLKHAAVTTIALLLMSSNAIIAKDIFLKKGEKKQIAGWYCTSLACGAKLCIQIQKWDGVGWVPGRARLFSDWTPGKYRDLDVHQGEYCDDLTGYIATGYELYALAEEHDLKLVVPDDMAY